MMVEGGKFDWACHANDDLTAYEIELLERAFDQAMRKKGNFPGR